MLTNANMTRGVLLARETDIIENKLFGTTVLVCSTRNMRNRGSRGREYLLHVSYEYALTRNSSNGTAQKLGGAIEPHGLNILVEHAEQVGEIG